MGTDTSANASDTIDNKTDERAPLKTPAERKRKKGPWSPRPWLTFAVQALLCLGTLGAFIAAVYYAYVADKTLTEIRTQTSAARVGADSAKKSADAAINSVKVANDTLEVQRKAVEKTLAEMKQQTTTMQASAKAAADANRLSRDSFLATQRPWINADIAVGGPLEYDSGGGMHIKLRFQLKNIGNSPATYVHIYARAYELFSSDPAENHRRLTEKPKVPPLTRSGFTLFPGNTAVQDLTTTIGQDVINKRFKDYGVWPIVVGTINYGSVFDNTHHYQTGFAVELHRSTRLDPTGSRMGLPWAIYPEDGNLPASELQVIRYRLGSDYAE